MTLLFLVACSDSAVTKVNSSPTADLTSHADGDVVTEGETTPLRGVVGDADHDLSDLAVAWYVAGSEVCPGSVPSSDGIVACDHTFDTAGGDVVLEVIDPEGKSATDRASLTVAATGAPTAELLAPDAAGVYYSDQLITFSGTVSDAEDAAESLLVSFETEALGDLGLDVDVGSDGTVQAFGRLDEGEHRVRLRVTDTSGKEAIDGDVIVVGPPNAAPACTITAPADGSAGPAGSEVRFEGSVADAEDTPEDLAVTWSSDKEGTLGAAAPDSDGSVRLATSALGLGTHVVTLAVADSAGAACTTSIYYTVGNPPELTLTAPADGDVVNEGEDVLFAATVSDGEDQPNEVALAWESDLDGLFSTAGADSSGEVSFRTDALQAGDHVVSVTATDLDGLYTVRIVSLTVNAVPTAPAVTLSPDPAGTEDALFASASGSVDPDGSGTVTYAYAWYEDGVLSSASTSASFPAASTEKDHTYRVVVTPSDTTGEGPPGEASITVSNTAPSVRAAVSPTTAQVGDTLICSATATDADGDDPAVTYAWGDGTAGDTYVVGAGDDAGDVVTCTATADDGEGGTSSATASATVDNTDPTVDEVTISPASPQVGDTLTCTATASDADGDSPALSYAWSDGTTGDTYALTSGDDPGDLVTCTVTATDADGGSDSASAAVKVGNTAPAVASVTVTPEAPYNDERLTCVATATDADGGSPTITYAWTDLAGGSLGTGATLELDSAGAMPGDTIQCTATATDADGGTASGEDTVDVTNRSPSASVSLTPASPSTGDTLTCTATVADDDGESLTTTFAWTVGGATVSASSTSGLTSTLAGAFDIGDEVSCGATTTDAAASASDSASVTIVNQSPVVSGVTLSPSSLRTDDVVTASATTSDPDGDTLTVTYAWYVDGVLVKSGTGATLDGGTYFSKDQEVVVEVSADDGTDTATASSSGVVVENTPPGAPTLAIEPSDPVAGEDLVCAIDTASTDPDADSVTYTMTWTVDGSSHGGTTTTDWSGDTVDGADVGGGETWACTATPNDGDDDGTTAEVSVTTESESWSGTIEMPSTGAVDGYSHGEWAALNNGGRTASRLVLTSACVNPTLALFQSSTADTSIYGSYYVMNDSGTVLAYTGYTTYSGCNNCWLPHATALSVTLNAGTTYYIAFQNGVGYGDMSGPNIYLDATARTVDIATFDDPRADMPGTNDRGLPTTTVSWQNRWRIECE